MATLVRADDLHQERTIHSLSRDVPTPFPIELLVNFEGSSDSESPNQLATEQVEYDDPTTLVSII